MPGTQWPYTHSLDPGQCIQQSFDPINDRIRVDAQVSVTLGLVEVIISHTNDSIRLGDGTSLVTATTVGPKVGIDVNLINTSPISVTTDGNVATPTITNVLIPFANSEQMHTFPAGTKKFLIRVRGDARLQFSYVVAGSSTSYITLPYGCFYEQDNLKLTGSMNLYFQCSKASQVLEILSWA